MRMRRCSSPIVVKESISKHEKTVDYPPQKTRINQKPLSLCISSYTIRPIHFCNTNSPKWIRTTYNKKYYSFDIFLSITTMSSLLSETTIWYFFPSAGLIPIKSSQHSATSGFFLSQWFIAALFKKGDSTRPQYIFLRRKTQASQAVKFFG